jgi:hypothetical protein
MVVRKIRLLLSVISVLSFLASCAPTLVGPIEPNSSLVIGRVVVNNKFPGAFHGLLPLGIIEKGLEIEIESRDGSQSFKVNTEEQGYFFIPNIPPNTYHILRVTLEGGRSPGDREKYGLTVRRPIFIPVPGKITYVGTLFVDLFDRGTSKTRDAREDEAAKTYFLQKYSASTWAPREFVSVGPKAAAGAQLAEGKRPPLATRPAVDLSAKGERPDWKVGYEWRFAWKQPGTSGTLTRQIVRETAWEGSPTYVMRAGKNEYLYTRDLGLVAEMLGGKLTSKRIPAYQNFSWPVEVGKEWRNTFLRENV